MNQLQSFPVNTHNEIQSSNTQMESDLLTRLKADTKQLRRYASEMALDDTINVEVGPDGSILMTPNSPSRRQLPNEILTLILDHLVGYRSTLYQCALVNKQFYAISNHLLWTQMDLCSTTFNRLFSTLTTTSTLQQQRLATLAHHVQQLTIRTLLNYEHYELLQILPYIPNLKRLCLIGRTRLGISTFERLPSYCQQLTSLKLWDSQLDHRCLSAIGHHWQDQLCSLELAIHSSESLLELLPLLSPCPLKHLCLTSADDDNGVCIGDSIEILQQFNHLETLEIISAIPLHGACILAPSPEITATDPTFIPWPQLKCLKLSHHLCDQLEENPINDGIMQVFIQSHPYLEHLELHDGYKLTDITMDAMTNWLPSLQHLTLNNSNVTSKALRRLVRKAHDLQCIIIQLRLYGRVDSQGNFVIVGSFVD